MYKKIKNIYNQLKNLLIEILIFLPVRFSWLKIWYFNKNGSCIENDVLIYGNVRLLDKIIVDEGSSFANNCTISAQKATIIIGKNVMIAPNVVIVAFDHNFADKSIPMSKQGLNCKDVIIEDDVWIGANCTITKGVKIGRGSIIGANSVVTKNVEEYSIYAGNPAKFIKRR